MLDSEALKELLSRSDLSNKDKVLTCLAAEPLGARTIADIRTLATQAGLRAIKQWNVSDYLSKSKTLVVRTPQGWELTSAGKTHVASVSGPLLPSVSVLVISGLRKQLVSIQREETREFVGEAVRCLESKLYRAGIVTSWVGAVAVLYDAVIKLNLVDFNIEACKRDTKWRPAKGTDDLGKMKEFEFLQVISAIGVIGKNVKNELEVCLKLRNGCGHPSSLIVGEHKASAHVETLIQNVFSKF